MLSEQEIKGIKDRIALGRKQGGNPTGGEEGPFYLYHLALDDLDSLINAVDPSVLATRDARIVELEAQLAEAKAIDRFPRGDDVQSDVFGKPRFSVNDPKGAEFVRPAAGEPLPPEHLDTVIVPDSFDAIGQPTTTAAVPPHVAEISDEERAKLLETAKLHGE